MRQGVEYVDPQEPVVKCPECKYYMRRLFPKWLGKVKEYKKELENDRG